MVNKAVTVQDEQMNIISCESTLRKICIEMGWRGFRYDYLTKQWNDDKIKYKGYLIMRHQL